MTLQRASIEHGIKEASRSELATLVARSAANLQQQQVLVLEIGIQSVDLQKQLAKKSLKVKFRMNGVTNFRTAAQNAVVDSNGVACIRFSTIGSTIFEGGDKLVFELCSSNRFGRSKTLSMGELSLAAVLDVVDIHSSSSIRKATSWNQEKLLGENSQTFKLNFASVDSHSNCLGVLKVEVGIRTPSLQGAGGIWRLGTIQVPQIPELCRSRSANAAEEAAKECLEFVNKATTALQCLQTLFKEIGGTPRECCTKEVCIEGEGAYAVDDCICICDDGSTSCGTSSMRTCEI